MEENKNIPESIWAPGVPQHIEDKDKITPEELHIMAIDYVVKNCLLKRGFTIEQGFPRKEFPNVVCKKDDQTYAIVIYPSVYPHYVAINDQYRLQLVELAKKNNAIALYAAVGYRSIDEERAKASVMLKGDVFHTAFPGFIILTDEEKQNMMVKAEELFRP